MPKTLEITRSFALSELKDLAGVSGPCVTFYVPLENAPNTSRLDAMRLKAMIRQSEEKLQQEWPDISQSAARKLIEPLRQIESESAQWGGEGGSLVVLRSADVFRAFETKQRLDEFCTVGPTFHVFPLIGTLQLAEQRFYILALSQNHVRLLRCTTTTSEEVELPESLPTSLEAWLTTRAPNSAPDRGAAHESETGATAGNFTSTADRDNKDQHLANYFRVVHKAVSDLLRDDSAPLILCGVESQRAMYKQIAQHPNVMEDGVQGSPESLKGGEMHSRALPIAHEFFAQPARKALAHWEKLGGSQRVSSSLPEIVKAAFEARVAQLFCAEGARTQGAFDRSTLEMTAQGRHEDLVNTAALQTVAYGGEVFILNPAEMPGGGQMSAIFRF